MRPSKDLVLNVGVSAPHQKRPGDDRVSMFSTLASFQLSGSLGCLDILSCFSGALVFLAGDLTTAQKKKTGRKGISSKASQRSRLAEALVSQNLFAYSYYSGAEKKTKMSLIQLDPSSHRMSPLGEPTDARRCQRGGVAFALEPSLARQVP